MSKAPSLPVPQKSPQDMGGEDSDGIDTIDQGMTFWQRQANALRAVAIGNEVIVLDELRRTAEELGADYTRLAYFEKTTTALRNLLVERKIINGSELVTKMDQIRARFNVPDELESPLKKGTSP